MKSNTSLRYRIGKVLLIALVAAQGLFAFSGCLLASSHIAMPFASVDMPGGCGDANKQACLMTYLQNDRAPAYAQAAPPACNDLGLSPPWVGTTPELCAGIQGWSPVVQQAAAPPPHILYCRLLN